MTASRVQPGIVGCGVARIGTEVERGAQGIAAGRLRRVVGAVRYRPDGPRTWEAATRRLGAAAFQGMKVFIASRTLRAEDAPGATILPQVTRVEVARIREQSKKDIWLFGGGELFRLMLALGEVDMVEVSIIPVLLGQGVPLLPLYPTQTILRLAAHRVYPSGRVALTYEVQPGCGNETV